MKIRRHRKSSSKLTPDQVQHLVQGWTPDCCTPYFRATGFPFRDGAHRRTLWEEHRAELVKQWGPAARMQGWYDFDATPEQRKAFDRSKVPNVWGWRSQHGDDGGIPRKVAPVVALPVEDSDDDPQ